MNENEFRECPLSMMSRTKAASPGRKLFRPALGPTEPHVCGETLVLLEDAILDEPVHHRCYGTDRSLWLMFQLKGCSIARIGGRVFDVRPGHMVALFGPHANRDVECRGETGFRRVTAKLGEEFVRRYFDRETADMPEALQAVFSGSRNAPFVHGDEISTAVNVSLQQLFLSPHKGSLGSMFMESRVLDIACACLSAIANAHSSQYSNSISADDIRRLHAARALLLEKLTSPPPGIRVLANEVGLNENKLKRGFRSLFGETVHACHRNARMDLARKLMLEGRLNVCEIACAVGYSNPSHFSRAFFNRFRVNPGAYLRDIRRSGFHACAAGADLLLPFE